MILFASIMFLRLLVCFNCFSNPYNFPAQWPFKAFECVCLVGVYVFAIMYRNDADGMDFADAVMKANMLAIATSIGYVFFKMMLMMGAIIAKMSLLLLCTRHGWWRCRTVFLSLWTCY